MRACRKVQGERIRLRDACACPQPWLLWESPVHAVSSSKQVQQLKPELSSEWLLVLAYALAYNNYFSLFLYSRITLLCGNKYKCAGVKAFLQWGVSESSWSSLNPKRCSCCLRFVLLLAPVRITLKFIPARGLSASVTAAFHLTKTRCNDRGRSKSRS